MMFAYIILKSRYLKLIIVRENKKVFTYKGKEYEIHTDCLFRKRILGIKPIFYSMYIEDCKNPLKFDYETGKHIMNEELSLDDTAYLMNKLKYGILGEIGAIVTIINLILLLIIIGLLTNA